MGTGKFNSDEHYFYYCRQDFLGRNEVALTVKQKNPKLITCMQSQKSQNNVCLFLSCGSEGKTSGCNAGDLGVIPGSGRSPGEGNRNPLWYSCLENPMDGEAW